MSANRITQIARTLRYIDCMREALKKNSTDSYTVGVYNGFELMRSILTEAKPVYLEKPKRTKK